MDNFEAWWTRIGSKTSNHADIARRFWNAAIETVVVQMSLLNSDCSEIYKLKSAMPWSEHRQTSNTVDSHGGQSAAGTSPMKKQIYCDRPRPIGEALAFLTDTWIKSDFYCQQTVIDLRDVCRALINESRPTVRAKRPVQQRKVVISCDEICHAPCKDRGKNRLCKAPVGDCSAQVSTTVA